MAEPSFNGVNFFGPCPRSNRIELPNARQLNGYPGVNGVEVIEHGWRTAATVFEGIWATPTAEGLGPFLGSVLAIKRAGGFAVLVDCKGLASPDAIFETFETADEVGFFPGFGWGVAYRLTFLHTGFVPN